MTGFLIYDAKVAVLIVVFYMFYRLLLSKETFHRVNRVVLLSTAVLSFLLPLCVITMHQTVVLNTMPVVSVGDVQMEVAADQQPALWQYVVPLLYIIGVVVVLSHTLLSVWRVLMLVRRSERHPQADGTTICVVPDQVPPFSFCSFIVMNRSDYNIGDSAILAHERGHIRLHHSCDVLLVDLLTALQWFNPAMWMLRADLRAIHEYEADGAVLSLGINARQYQYLLITKAASIGGYSIANGISHSTLKNRIHMMTNKKTRSSHLLKLLALLPIIGTALALNARTVTDYVYDEPQKKQIIKKGKANAKINAGNVGEVVVVEQAPKVESTTEDNEPFTVRGKVFDDAGKPVIGAVVLIDGSKKGSVTDVNGAFAIKANMGDYLNISYVGLETVRLGVSKMFAKEHEYLIPMRKENESGKKPFDVVEQMPQFPGGSAALMEYLSKNVRYPEEAHKKGVQGRVIATFVVEKDGSITEAHIARSVDDLLDAEALRVVNAMPKWAPGMQKGEPVRVKYTVPITFKLQGDTKPATEEKYVLEIDGKVVDDSEIANIPPGDIANMQVIKAENGHPKKIVITTKKK